MKKTFLIPAERLPVAAEADVCVIGGSCTGVFAAIRAARLGAKVVILERQNRFGGTAVNGLVCMWHNLFDITGERQIIGGLTFEALERLEKRGAAGKFRTPYYGIPFNSEELTLVLDRMVTEQKNIRTFFHTAYSRPVMVDGIVKGIVAENKSGRFVIAAKMFVDASGDGLLCRDAGFPMRLPERSQPPTACAKIENFNTMKDLDLKKMLEENRKRYPDLPCGYAWGTDIPGSEHLYMFAGTRVMNCNCMNADAVTAAEFESRRQLDAVMHLFREKYPEAKVSLQALPSAIGIRESMHIRSIGTLIGEEMLADRKYEDTIGAGTYPVDIHSNTDDSISFRSLDGKVRVCRSSKLIREERWLPEGKILPYYRIPLSCLIPQNSRNVIAAGRMLDADATAFGAVRVMVNLNQCGEAAGTAACLAADAGQDIAGVSGADVRSNLNRGGSLIPE